MKYRIATVDIPRATYAHDEWRRLPQGERIVHVFASAMTADGSMVVLIEQDDDK